MYLDETQRFQMALNTDFVLLLTNTRHAIKRKMQEQRNFCTVDGSLREIVFTPRTDRSIRRHSIRTTLFFSPFLLLFFFFPFFPIYPYSLPNDFSITRYIRADRKVLEHTKTLFGRRKIGELSRLCLVLANSVESFVIVLTGTSIIVNV